MKSSKDLTLLEFTQMITDQVIQPYQEEFLKKLEPEHNTITLDDLVKAKQTMNAASYRPKYIFVTKETYEWLKSILLQFEPDLPNGWSLLVQSMTVTELLKHWESLDTKLTGYHKLVPPKYME